MDRGRLRFVLCFSLLVRSDVDLEGLDEISPRRSRGRVLCVRRSAPVPSDANSGLSRVVPLDSKSACPPKARAIRITRSPLRRLIFCIFLGGHADCFFATTCSQLHLLFKGRMLIDGVPSGIGAPWKRCTPTYALRI